MKKKYKFKERRIYKLSQIMIILIIIISCLSIISIFARYVLNQVNDFYLRSKEFYFYSDKLESSTAHYEIDNWSGVDDYTITVNMNSMANNLKASSYDISYDISYECSSNVICQISKNSGTILASNNSDYFNLILTPNKQLGTGDKVWVKITAISTSKYTKKISADFTLVVGKEDLTYEIKDAVNNPYLDLNITNTLSYYTISENFSSYTKGNKIDRDTYLALLEDNRKRCYSALVTLKFDPQIVILDMTNTNYLNATNVGTRWINGKAYISEITFKVDAISSTSVRFYKADKTKNYTYPITNSQPIITVSNI